uniref:Glycerophosphocholine acyltransferase 1 n=1 Tax=Prymnesium polylepis TaxID=72548 RepID=A0A7S4N9C3_9EUKA
MLGYLFERFTWLSFAVPCFYIALTNPGYYQHLTYWTLMLHTVYFTVDKASPDAKAAIYLLHGFSFCGAIAVFVGYSFISVCGGLHHGSWLLWENAVGARAGTVTTGRTFTTCFIQKAYEHLWPVIAVLMDTRLSKGALKRVYAGAGPWRNLCQSMGSFFVLGSVWEAVAANKDGKNVLIVYQQPPYMSSAHLLGLVGLPADGLAEDFVFVTMQKVLLISCAAITYAKVVWPIMRVDGGKKGVKAKAY